MTDYDNGCTQQKNKLVPGQHYTFAERDEAVTKIIGDMRKTGCSEYGLVSILRGRGDMTESEIESAMR